MVWTVRICVQANDFGGEVIPWAAADGYKVQAYLFNDYWEDIGTIKSFFEANLALAAQVCLPPNALTLLCSRTAACWQLLCSRRSLCTRMLVHPTFGFPMHNLLNFCS